MIPQVLKLVGRALFISIFLLSFAGASDSDGGNGHGHGHGHGHGGCDGSCADHCQNMMTAIASTDASERTHLFGSGQMGEEDLVRLTHLAKEVYAVAQDLGYTIPPNHIRWATATDVAGIVGNVGHPAPHAEIGARVLQVVEMAMGVYEVVFPGTHVAQQFTRDTNNYHENALIFAHVIGHLDFFMNSQVYQIRGANPIESSRALAEFMLSMHRTVGKEEVNAFYQKLLTLEKLQDVTRGTYDAPQTFRNGQVPHPSRSILQAMSVNMPADAPFWKRRMIELYEQHRRDIGAALQTKIMNEGWATVSQYIILSHTSLNSGDDAIRFARLNAGVRRPGIGNPYWLGSEAWFRLRERFHERPEMRGLSNKDKDKAFLVYAKEVMATQTDHSFLQRAFDESWVRRHQLFVKTRVSPERSRVVSRQPEDVLGAIARDAADRDRVFPKIYLLSLRDPSTGALVLRHDPIDDVPLDMMASIRALFDMAQVMSQPVTLHTVGTTLWKSPQERHQSFPFVVTVTPDGQVRVGGDLEQIKAMGGASFVGRLRDSIQSYRYDLELSYPTPDEQLDLSHYQSALLSSSNIGLDGAMAFSRQAPTTILAVREYLELAGLRLKRSLKLAVKGKFPMQFTKNGSRVRIRVLPIVPEIKLDERIAKSVRQQVSGLTQLSAAASALRMRESYGIGQGPYLPGQEFDDPEDKQNQDSGDGEGESSDEDTDSDQSGKGQKGSQSGANDPHYAEVPIEMLGELLAEEIELRNLRPTTDGSFPVMEEIETGFIRSPVGNVHYPRTAQEAYRRGIAAHRARQLRSQLGRARPPTPLEIMRQGLRQLRDEDIFVRDTELEPTPRVGAVIVWTRDISGSISDQHRAIITNFIANVRAVLKSRYPFLVEEFVWFNTEAGVFEGPDAEKKFLTIESSGGTIAKKGVEKAKEILESKYRPESFNRFVVYLTDGDDWSEQSAQETADLIAEYSQQIEQFSYGHVEGGFGGSSSLSAKLLELHKANPEKIGFARHDGSFEKMINALRVYFGKNGNPDL
jgi:stage V sporulation protein R